MVIIAWLSEYEVLFTFVSQYYLILDGEEDIVYCQQNSIESAVYRSGCNSGIRSFGILSKGDVVCCTYIRNSKLIEGNVREYSFRNIW